MSKPSLPTLMIKGKLVSPTGDPSLQPELDNWIPYEYILEWFRSRAQPGIANRVLILKSETASGKSTLLPPKIYEAFVQGKKIGMICTQPRVLTAVENVKQMLSNYKFLRLGENVGWSTKENKIRPKNVGLLSATIGTLTQQLKTMTDEEIMNKYKFILIDETHERDLQTDMTIYMLKSLLSRQKNNPSCPFVVLMSATFEPDSFLRYFGVERKTNFIWCRGEAAGFEEMWEWNEGRTVNNYPQAASQVVEKIIREGSEDAPERGDVFVFLPGAAEIRETVKYMNELNKKFAGEGVVTGDGGKNIENKKSTAESAESAKKGMEAKCPVTGGDVCYCDAVKYEEYKGDYKGEYKGAAPIHQPLSGTNVFRVIQIDSVAVRENTKDIREIAVPLMQQTVAVEGKMYVPSRRVILTTNVAETGLTVDSIKYVIDAGFNREVEFNPLLGVTALLTKPAPQSRIRQRKGRAGRKFRGVFYPLYPHWIYEKLPQLQLPQILTSDVSPIILDIVFEQLRAKKAAGDRNPTFRIEDVDMVDVPAADALFAAIEKLFAIGFLRYEPAPWTGPTMEDARGIVDGEFTGLEKPRPSSEYPGVRTIGFTRFGAIAAVVATPSLLPETLRMIFAAYSWGVDITEIITIAAYLSIDPQMGLARKEDGKKVPIRWDIIYKDAMPHITTQSLQLITADEWIDGLVLFTAVRNIVKTNLTGLATWCNKVGVAIDIVLKLIAERDDLINHFLENEFAINTRADKLADAPADNYMDVVTRIKHCIYDGWRCNLLTFDDKIGKYRSGMGTIVGVPKFLQAKYKNVEMRGKLKPGYIIAQDIGVKYNRELDIYDAVPGLVSVQDGFVAPDVMFTV